jgi:hypothetical protein
MISSDASKDGISVDINPQEITELLQTLRAIPDAAKKVGHEIALILREKAIASTPVDTGLLKGSWGPVTAGQEEGYAFQNTTPYAYVPELGLYKGIDTKRNPVRTAYGPDGGIYSTQAIGGIVRPLIEEMDGTEEAINLLEQAIDRLLNSGA